MAKAKISRNGKPETNRPTLSADEIGTLAKISDRLESICILFDSACGDVPVLAVHGVIKPIDSELAELLRGIRERVGETAGMGGAE